MATKMSHSRSSHSRLSSSSSESDTTPPGSDASSCGDAVTDRHSVTDRHICHSARMRGRRHAVDHGRETPIPVEDLEILMTTHHPAMATTHIATTQQTRDKKSASTTTTKTMATRKIRANCTAVGTGK